MCFFYEKVMMFVSYFSFLLRCWLGRGVGEFLERFFYFREIC